MFPLVVKQIQVIVVTSLFVTLFHMLNIESIMSLSNSDLGGALADNWCAQGPGKIQHALG